MKKSIREKIFEWNQMPLSCNPYGDSLPEKYLNSTSMIKPEFRTEKTFGEYMQNGYIAQKVINNFDKSAPWEAENPVIFSEIGEKLHFSNSLCPSNYLVHVLKTLKEKEIQLNTTFSEEYIEGMLCRSLRTFASFVRECQLREDIENIVNQISTLTDVPCQFNDVSSNIDIKEKTDVLFLYNNCTYRVWSYQTTLSGVDKTSHRIVDDFGKSKLSHHCNYGYNILMPFDIKERKEVLYGWYLYDKKYIRETIISSLLKPEKALKHKEFNQMVFNNRNTIKEPLLFLI